jgi:hypothetical protein
LPPFPERRVPFFLRRIALLTDFLDALPYLAISTSSISWLEAACAAFNPLPYVDGFAGAMTVLLYAQEENAVLRPILEARLPGRAGKRAA